MNESCDYQTNSQKQKWSFISVVTMSIFTVQHCESRQHVKTSKYFYPEF